MITNIIQERKNEFFNKINNYFIVNAIKEIQAIVRSRLRIRLILMLVC